MTNKEILKKEQVKSLLERVRDNNQPMSYVLNQLREIGQRITPQELDSFLEQNEYEVPRQQILKDLVTQGLLEADVKTTKAILKFKI
jgi:hypothetical protein